MRFLSVGEAAAIVAPEGCWIFANMRVQNYGGGWLNLGALSVGGETLEFFNEATFTDSRDRNTLSLTATFAREIGNHSLVPFRSDSDVNSYGGDYQPALDLARRWDLWVAVVEIGTVPVNADYREHARGWIDRIDVSGDPAIITVQARGEEAALIEERIIWGDTPDVPISETNPATYTTGLVGDVVQQILDKQLGGGAVALTVDASVDPTAAIGGWDQIEEIGMFDLIVQTAALRGMLVRYRYDDSDVLTLTLFTPNRNPTTPDWSVDEGPGGYEKLDVGIDIAPVRNYIVVRYVDSVGAIQVVTSPPSPVSPSISRYRKRTLGIDLSAKTQVTTEAAAQDLADAVRSDIEFPPLEQSMDATAYWFAEVGDYVEFEENGIHYNENQFGAVLDLTQHYANGTLKTSAKFTAKPVGSYRGWLDFAVGTPKSATDIAPAVTSSDAAYREFMTGLLHVRWVNVAATVNEFTQSVVFVLYDDPALTTPLQTQALDVTTPPTVNWAFLGVDPNTLYYVTATPWSGPLASGVPTGVAGDFALANTTSQRKPTDTPTVEWDLSDPAELKANVVGGAGVEVGELVGSLAIPTNLLTVPEDDQWLALSTIPTAETEVGAEYRQQSYAVGVGSVRVGANIKTRTGTPTIGANYSLDGFSTTPSLVSFTPAGTGVRYSAWAAMPTAAKADIGLTWSVGAGADTAALDLYRVWVEYLPTTVSGARVHVPAFAAAFN